MTPGALVGLLILAALDLSLAGSARLSRTHDVRAEAVAIPAGEAALARGAHLVNVICATCHGANLAGGQPPDPAAPPAPNLTPGGSLGACTEDDLVAALRSGVTPIGRELNREWMPWEFFGQFAGAELAGLWLYLQSLPALEAVV